MASRQYDYATPNFGGYCVPPPSWDTPGSRDTAYRSSNRQALVKQSSITSASPLARSDSSTRNPYSRVDSLTRSPLTRTNSNPRSPLARTDSNPRSPLARQESASFTYTAPPTSYRTAGYVDRFRNFDLM